MTITPQRLTYRRVEVRPVLVPLKRPIVSRVGSFAEWPLILIDLHTREGIVGRSYLEPYLKQAARYIVPAIHDLATAREGAPVRPLHDFQAGRRALHLVGYEGIAMIAVAGLDMAAWDALAKAAGMPLAELLGGSTGAVDAYNSNGLWLGDPERLAAEAAELMEEGGFGALKIRLGHASLADDLRALRNVRLGAGEGVRLMADFNQGLGLADALRRCHALDALGLDWFEEPLSYDSTRAHAQLAHELATPLQLGENFYGPREVSKALEAGACDCVMFDPMRIGGVTGWLRAAPVAAAMNIQVSSHLYPEVCAHLLRVTETAHWLEWQDWANPVLAEPFELAAGQLRVPDRPGCGLEWNEEAVRRYAYTP